MCSYGWFWKGLFKIHSCHLCFLRLTLAGFKIFFPWIVSVHFLGWWWRCWWWCCCRCSGYWNEWLNKWMKRIKWTSGWLVLALIKVNRLLWCNICFNFCKKFLFIMFVFSSSCSIFFITVVVTLALLNLSICVGFLISSIFCNFSFHL